MDLSEANFILDKIGFPAKAKESEPFYADEDGKQYHVWKLVTDQGTVVLKQISRREREVYETFFLQASPVAKIFGFYDNWMVMEYVKGTSLSRCTRERLICVLDALIDLQERFWDNQEHADTGYCFSACLADRQKRLSFMEDLSDCYEAYLQSFCTVPRTLCNDDMLPFNVLCDGHRAVILDWEWGGILPYPSALARFLAFGEENEDALFFMAEEDRLFALEYYYHRLIRQKGISREEYLLTMKLFLFKEYSEWIYCANQSGEESDYSIKYAPMARQLAAELGF